MSWQSHVLDWDLKPVELALLKGAVTDYLFIRISVLPCILCYCHNEHLEFPKIVRFFNIMPPVPLSTLSTGIHSHSSIRHTHTQTPKPSFRCSLN